MNRLPKPPDQFDHRLQLLQQHANGALSHATLARLRGARQANAAEATSPWRRRGWWLATACSAVLAVTAALQFDRAPPPAAPVLADDAGDIPDDTLLFEQSPELYLWLGSDALAME